MTDPWNPAFEAELAQAAAAAQRAKSEPLAVAREVLAAMKPGSPDGRDVSMGLQGIGLALVDIADSLRALRAEAGL